MKIPLLITLALLLAPSLARAQAGAPPAPASLDRKMVWAHSMVAFPLELSQYLSYHPEGYGALYPLRQEAGLEQQTGLPWPAVDIEDAKAEGIDGFSLDVFTGSTASYLAAADRAGGFLIAPCIDLSVTPQAHKEAEAVQIIEQNCKAGMGHPSAAKVNGKFLFFTYGTDQLTPEAWGRVRAQVAQDGFAVYIMAAVAESNGLFVQPAFPAARIQSYLPPFEAAYSFGTPGPYWNDLLALVARNGKPFGGGMLPGYFRNGAGFQDAQATAMYRAEWQQHLDSRLPWASVTTWNDLMENTEIMPSSDWNLTRSALTRWFTARFKGQPLPWTEPRLFVTTPKTIYPGQAAVAEGLALNGGMAAAQVSVSLQDGAGQAVGAPVTVSVAPGQDGAATAPVLVSTFPAGRFLRARATLTQNGKTLASVVSAPILVLDEAVQPGYHTLYYSVPAENALPGIVKLSVAGTPTTALPAQASVTAPPGTDVRFAEVLHNTALVKNFYHAAPFATPVPGLAANGAVLGETEWGFYLARVTDQQMRVGYSDPIYVAPAGDLSLQESYSFDEGQGRSAHDSSIFHKAGDLIDVAWVTPGVDGSGACVGFNGSASRINLATYQAPSGPMALSVAVRPRAYAGTVYADTGGMWLAFTPEGRPLFVRLGPGGWTRTEGKTALPLGQWSRVRTTWDGAACRVYVNGVLEGETACGPKFRSARRALGCNPFHGTDFYSGDLDDFSLRAIEPAAAPSPVPPR